MAREATAGIPCTVVAISNDTIVAIESGGVQQIDLDGNAIATTAAKGIGTIPQRTTTTAPSHK